MVSLFYISCSSEPPTLFEVNTDTVFIIPAGLDNFRTHTFILRNIPTRISSQVTTSNEDAISGIFPNRANIRAPFINFDFRLVNSVIINIWDSANPEDKREVFFMDILNNRNSDQLQLFSSLSEVKDILLNDTFNAEVRIIFRSFTPTEIESRLTMNFVAHGR